MLCWLCIPVCLIIASNKARVTWAATFQLLFEALPPVVLPFLNPKQLHVMNPCHTRARSLLNSFCPTHNVLRVYIIFTQQLLGLGCKKLAIPRVPMWQPKISKQIKEEKQRNLAFSGFKITSGMHLEQLHPLLASGRGRGVLLSHHRS